MAVGFKEYLDSINFDKYLKKIKSKYKNKKIIIYGTGVLFQYVKEHYDLSELNIIGVSDLKFSIEQEGQDFDGYKIIPKEKMIDYNPDVVLIATQKYVGIVEDFVLNIFNNTKTKVLPLARISIRELLKEIWSR